MLWLLDVFVFVTVANETFEFHDGTADVGHRDFFLLHNIAVPVVHALRDGVVVHYAEGDFFVEIFVLLGQLVGACFD